MFIDLLWRCLSLLLKKYEEKIMEYLKNYMYVAHKVKEIIRKTDPDAKIYVFGSVVKGKYTASSDIDILVVTKDIKKKDQMKVNVYKEIDAPIELHIVTSEKFYTWYKKFIKTDEIIEI